MSRRAMLTVLLSALLGSPQALGQAPAMEEAVVIEEESATPMSRFWVSGEYLLWWVKNGSAPPPLATTAPSTSPALSPGALGLPDTTVVLGGDTLDYPVFSGARFTVGSALGAEGNGGIEASYFFLGEQRISQGVGAGAFGNFLVNPFFDVSPTPPAETGNFLAPGTAGTSILTSTSRLQGAECNGLFNFWNGGAARLHLLAGFRFLNLRETLSLATVQTDPLASFFPGQFVNTQDDFSTQNYYYAGQMGARLEFARGRFFVNATGKVALGSMHEVVNIQGTTTTNTGPGFAVGTPVAIPVTTVPGGIYAQPTNIGQFENDRFAVAPEAIVQVGYQLGSARLFVGYNFLYISEVARPGEQIDRAINSTQLTSFTGVPTGPLVGPARPTPTSNSTDFWAQGINFGLEFRY